MNLNEQFLNKEEINSRFIMAVYAILRNKLVNSKADLAESLNIKPSKFSEILNNRMKAGIDVIARMCDLYRISPDWLLLSRGYKMFRDDYSMPVICVNDDPSTLNSDPPKINHRKDVKSEGVNIPVARHTLDQHEGIPLIPFSAMAGALSGEHTALDYECEHYVVPAFQGADFLIPIKGCSMYPTYASGDIVACKRVPMTDIFFQWNKVYVIDTCQGALIKRIKPGKDNEHILIVSDNEEYDPFELAYSEIYAVALVIGGIRLE